MVTSNSTLYAISSKVLYFVFPFVVLSLVPPPCNFLAKMVRDQWARYRPGGHERNDEIDQLAVQGGCNGFQFNHSIAPYKFYHVSKHGCPEKRMVFFSLI